MCRRILSMLKIYVMNRFWFKLFAGALTVALSGLVMFLMPMQVWALQEPGFQSDSFATVIYSDPINVRGGPSTVFYPIVGRLSPGDVVPALGVSPGREWVQIAYPDASGGAGWVYAAYVSISGGELRIVEPPPTPAPFATATIDPTLAAAFIYQPTPTRMPTFTPPPPLDIPQFADAGTNSPSGIPSGMVVFGLGFIGVVGLFVSFMLRRR